MRCSVREVRSKRRRLLRCVAPGLVVLCAALAQADPITAPLVDRLEAEIELGRRLFFDPMASPSKQRACASCHDPNHGFSDPKRLSADDFGITTRHSQTIIDGARNPSAHWDGEFATVGDLVRKRVGTSVSPWARPVTPPPMPNITTEPRELLPHGNWGPLADGTRPTKETARRVKLTNEVAWFLVNAARSTQTPLRKTEGVARDIEEEGHYEEAFEAAYGTPEVTIDRIARAIEAYCKTIESTPAPIDRFLAGDEIALSNGAKRGLALFRGRAGCVQCHTMDGARPSFTDYGFRNTGLAWQEIKRRHKEDRLELLGRAMRDPRLALHRYVKGSRVMDRLKAAGGPVQLLADVGRGKFAGVASLDRHFKTPTLRDVAKRPPYMHDGSLKTLEDVVRYYADGCCVEDPSQDRRLEGFEASDQDVKDLVAFLRALSGEKRPGLAASVWPLRADKTRARIVSPYGDPLPKVRVVLDPEGDILPVIPGTHTSRQYVTSDEEGWVEFAPAHRTHTRVRLVGDEDPNGGLLIPDSCREVDVGMPIAGHATVQLVLREGRIAPEAIGFRQLENPSVVTRLARVTVNRTGKGDVEALYYGWVRNDLKFVQLDMPGLTDPLRGGKPAMINVSLGTGEKLRLDLRTYGWRDAVSHK